MMSLRCLRALACDVLFFPMWPEVSRELDATKDRVGVEVVQRFITIGIITVIAFFAANSALASQGVSVDASRIGDASHFEFGGSTDWKYDLKRDAAKGTVTLRLPAMKADAIARLRGHSDALIRNVAINDKGIDGTTELTFTLAPNADFFDYLTEQPSRLVVDFFPKDPSVPSKEPARPAEKKTAPAKTAETKLPVKRSVASTDEEEEADEDAPRGAVRDITAEITGVAKPQKAPKKAKEGKGDESEIVVAGPPSLAEQISSQKDFSHGIFDGGDPEFTRFSIKDYEIREEAIIASRVNYYLPFPMLDLGNQQLKTLIGAAPTYEIIPNDTRENKEARIILKLFHEGKRALFLTTSAEFLKKFPQSQYDEIIRYMVADTHEAMWREKNSVLDFETAMSQYQLLTEKYPNSPISARTLLYMGYAYVERGDSFGALKAFQRFLRLHPESKHVDRVNIAIAEAYLKLNRYDETLALLDQIEKTARTTKAKHEAAFRKGNVFFRKRDWLESIKTYQAAIQKYPEATSNFPNAYYNIAEAQFRLGQHREALESYRKFLVKFPDHEHGGYAMTRMGELLGVLGADPKRAQGAFLESFFRYRATPGAGVARIRALTMRMPEMKDKELGAALIEIKEITEKYANSPSTEEKKEKAKEEEAAKKPAGDEQKTAEAGKEEGATEVRGPASVESKGPAPERYLGLPEKRPELPGIEEFTILLLADGWTARKEYDSAAKDLIAYYQQNPQSPNKERITSRIINNMTLGIREAVERGDFMEGLRRYSKNTSGWLKNANRIDVRYDVGRAYEHAGVFKEAAAVYRECVKRLAEIKNAGKEREQAVFERLPKSDQLNLRLAAVSAKEKDYAQAESYLRNIASKPSLSEPEMIESAEIAAEVAEARGKVGEARKYMSELIKAWKGDPELTSPLHLRIAKLDGAKKNYKDADEHLAKIIDLRTNGGRVNDDVYAKALELRGELMVQRGKPLDAIKTYRDLIEQFAEKRPLSSARYRLGQLLFQTGDLKGAQAAWGELTPERDGLWARLATEQMQGAQWQKEYKKYLSRIPAAADLRK